MKPGLKKIFYIGAVILLSLLCGCEENIGYYNDEKSGSRNYEWTSDTIPFSSGNVYWYMWGSSSNDIWITGICNDDKENLLHYNGKQFIDCNINVTCPRSLSGTNRDDIWLTAHFGEFWYYNGTGWEMKQKVTVDGFDMGVLLCGITSVTKNEYYACGFVSRSDGYYKALLYKYDGQKWSLVNIPELHTSFQSIYYDNATGHLIIRAESLHGIRGIKSVYSYCNGHLETVLPDVQLESIQKMGGRIVVTLYENGIYNLYKYNSNKFDKILSVDSRFKANMGGRNLNDIFFYSIHNGKYGIGHYDGYDFSCFFPVNADLDNSQYFDNQSIFMMEDFETHKTFLLKGKLK
jgi:hypothetical protein